MPLGPIELQNPAGVLHAVFGVLALDVLQGVNLFAVYHRGMVPKSLGHRKSETVQLPNAHIVPIAEI